MVLQRLLERLILRGSIALKDDDGPMRPAFQTVEIKSLLFLFLIQFPCTQQPVWDVPAVPDNLSTVYVCPRNSLGLPSTKANGEAV